MTTSLTADLLWLEPLGLLAGAGHATARCGAAVAGWFTGGFFYGLNHLGFLLVPVMLVPVMLLLLVDENCSALLLASLV